MIEVHLKRFLVSSLLLNQTKPIVSKIESLYINRNFSSRLSQAGL